MKNITPSRTRNAYPLTSVRFFLALLVVFHHSTLFFLPGAAAAYVAKDYLSQLLFSPIFSVGFFFLLSGYVLSMVYLRGGRDINKPKFFAARFARLYPLYFVVMLADATRILAEKISQHGLSGGLQKTAEILGLHLLLLQGWAPRVTIMDLPSWTLTSEVFFYLCFPMLGVLLWKLRGPRLWMTAAGVYAGGQALSLAISPHLWIKTATVLPLLHISTFILGVLLARWQTLQQGREGHAVPRLWHVNLALLLSIAGIFGSIVILAHIHNVGLSLHGVLSPFFMGIIWALSARPTLLSKLLSASWLVALGNASYAIYLIHFPLLQLFRHLHWCVAGMFPVYLAVCIGLSLLSFFTFETPVRYWLVDWFEARRPEVSAVPGSVAP